MKKRIIVIGGGPAGMMAAIAAGKNGSEVLLLEQNKEVGKKLLITGNGRCNITNSAAPREMLSHIYRNPKFLSHALQNFTNRDLLALLSSYGLRTKEEDNGRIFPISDKAEDVKNALLTILKDTGVKTVTGFEVESLMVEDGTCVGVRGADRNKNSNNKKDSLLSSKGVKKDDNSNNCGRKEFVADTVILATGGLAAPSTGATGWGIEIAKKLGHTVIEPKPGLSSIRLEEKAFKEAQGLALKDIRLFIDKKKETRGDLLFTHFGISGPAAIKMSSLIWRDREKQIAASKDSRQEIEVLSAIKRGDTVAEIAEAEKKGIKAGRKTERESSEKKLYLDSLPSLSKEELEALIKEETLKQGNRQVRTILNDLAPKDFIRLIFHICEVPEERRLGDLSKIERYKLIDAFKALTLEIKEIAGFNQAMITSGGILTREIDPKTMESKLIKNLRFAGEIIDVDAETGGYNLQIAWSTGWLAGRI